MKLSENEKTLKREMIIFISNNFDERLDQIQTEVDFRKRLEFDSLDEVELNMAIEEALLELHRINIEYDDNNNLVQFKTLDELANEYIRIIKYYAEEK